jgi:hypothetical protein
LKDACNQDVDCPEGVKIPLTGEDPAVFELFVEWMHNGVYTLDSPLPETKNPGVNINAQAWSLGERLGAPSFKLYTISRLHSEYDPKTEARLIIPADVDYVFTRTSSDSKLRTFFSHMLVTSFLTPARTEGSAMEWDAVLQKHDYLRRFLMSNLRKGTHCEGRLNSLKSYIDGDGGMSALDAQAGSDSVVIPAKRDADGELVKKEPTNA